MKALILVDLQNDFFPWGSLPVKNADQILPIINKLLTIKWDLIVASKDWHPQDHESFAMNHQRNVGDKIHNRGLEQILWPVHCVQKTSGAEFASGWKADKVDRVVLKGTQKEIDSYSVFFDNAHLRSTGLEDFLNERQIKEVYLAGLATDYCVKYSALDSCQLGFQTYVIEDACQGVDLREGDSTRAFAEMRDAGAKIIRSDILCV